MIVKDLPKHELNEIAACGLITREEYEAAMDRQYPGEPKLSAEEFEAIAQSFMTTERT